MFCIFFYNVMNIVQLNEACPHPLGVLSHSMYFCKNLGGFTVHLIRPNIPWLKQTLVQNA